MAALFSLLPFFCFIQLSLVFFLEASGAGFTVDLIHRDSPQSPFHSPSHSRLDRINNAVRRSLISSQIQAPISANLGSYLMKISIGSPPVTVLGIPDTGSDLTWTQCKPCVQCIDQDTPIFDHLKSGTYKPSVCDSPACKALGPDYFCHRDACVYTMSYYDSSKSIGELASDSFTFGSTSGQEVTIPNVTFGCGYQNAFASNRTASGIIGLGGGELSIIRQLDEHIQGKFSYCLVHALTDPNVTSKMNFGSNAIVSGRGVTTTPLIVKGNYYLTLEWVSVGDKIIQYEAINAETGQEGNIIIDSGTTLTSLPPKLYGELESALKEAIGSQGQTAPDPQGVLSLCYKNGGALKLPIIKFHFTNSSVDLQPSSTFIDVPGDLLCLAMIPSDGISTFGNLSQMNLLIGYDLVGKTVSFKAADCTK
ncbi:hypothetical protein RJ639_025675 [Escallonia herrerae]|uniref:Peptidase A1 domain-containing protein n=1 Tax=Escallonia herrerae TaxID=1293975 RepID=A0AA88RVW5_9ASTE|nr:hypothetical protein RJ639_025675 [Escallonia herrerae]